MAAKTKQPEAESDEAEAEAAPEKPKRGWLRLALIAAAGLVLCGGLAGGAWYFYFSALSGQQQAAAPPPKPPAFFDMPEVLVNLSNPGGERTQYLKVKIVLELADAALVQQIQPVMPRVMDTFQVFLRELRPTDLDGSAGAYRLKEELTRRVNLAIAPSRINAVLFKEMVIQ